MEELPLLNEFVVIFVLSIVVLLTCHRLKVPSVVGFLATGMLCGPYGFKFVSHIEDVQSMASLGIILLLFTVGMEVSIKKIIELKRLFLVGGGLQVLLTVLAGFLVAFSLGKPVGEGIFLGCLLALSSTAVVLRMMVQKGESDTPHGRGSLAVLIFQDFCAVPMMLIIPFLAGGELELNWGLAYSAVKGIGIIVAVFIAASYIVPYMLYYVAKTRMRELFLLAVLCICMGVAWFSQLAGLSLSLGAFLAGLIISQSDFSHEAISDVAPFQDLFTSFFFVSVGMLLDINFVTEHPILIATLTVLVIAMKSSMATIAGIIAGLPLRSAAWVGLSLAQISEFSFVLAKVGADNALAPPFLYQLFLAVAVLSIALTPWMIDYAHTIAGWIESLPLPQRYKQGLKAPKSTPVEQLKDHTIIVGFGLSGRALARSCKEAKVPYAIVEMNAQTVRDEKNKGEPIHFGDASHEGVLEHMRIHDAKIAAVLINDPAAALRIVKKIKQMHPSIYLIVRTRYVQEVKYLYSLGASDVIPDEYGSAVEVYARVLQHYSVPAEKIQSMVQSSLGEGYELLRMQYWPSMWGGDAHYLAEDMAIRSFRIGKESPYCGKPLRDWSALLNTQVKIVAVRRGDHVSTIFDDNHSIENDDIIVVLGPPKKLQTLQTSVGAMA